MITFELVKSGIFYVVEVPFSEANLAAVLGMRTSRNIQY